MDRQTTVGAHNPEVATFRAGGQRHSVKTSAARGMACPVHHVVWVGVAANVSGARRYGSSHCDRQNCCDHLFRQLCFFGDYGTRKTPFVGSFSIDFDSRMAGRSLICFRRNGRQQPKLTLANQGETRSHQIPRLIRTGCSAVEEETLTFCSQRAVKIAEEQGVRRRKC